jgi:hypothetical protein
VAAVRNALVDEHWNCSAKNIARHREANMTATDQNFDALLSKWNSIKPAYSHHPQLSTPAQSKAAARHVILMCETQNSEVHDWMS